MWANFALQGGSSLLQNGVGYLESLRKAKSDRLWQAYRNAVTRMADAHNQGTIQINENLAEERSAEEAFNIQKIAYQTKGRASVAAASVGAVGDSVNMTMFDIERNADNAQRLRQSDLEAQYLQFDQQREASSWQMQTNIDYSPIPNPSPVTAMLNFGTDMIGIAKQNGIGRSSRRNATDPNTPRNWSAMI